MTITERIDAARSRQQQLLDASRAANNERLNDEEQREYDAQQAIIDALSGIDPTDDSEARNAGAAAERQRVTEINEICRNFGIDPAQYINDGGMTVDQVRAAVLEHLRKHNTGIPAGIEITDEKDKFRAAATDAILLKAGIAVEKPAAGAEELRGRSLREIAREAAIRDGIASGAEVFRMDDDTLMKRSFFQPEASFPSIADAAVKKSVKKAYQDLPTTFDKWTSKGSLPDFKESRDHEYLLGSFSEMRKVQENGELEQGTVPDQLLPTRKLDTYGRSFSLTRQAFIDDDIGFVTALPGKFAASAKRTIEKQVYTLVFNNSAIYDGKTLFHADHKNYISSGAAPSQSTIQAAIKTGRKMTDPFGEPILWTPKYLVVPIGYEFDLAVIFRSAQVVGSANNDINPLYNYPLEVIQTPVINNLAGANASPWFLVADPASCAGIQVDYLNGQETPNVRRMEKPGVLGLHWDVFLDWGINVRDFRGIIRNNGAVVS